MEHLGDITKISGHTVPTVDCIIGGSPCQDLSVAGKRAGLDGERSGLYIEQVRIVKEMRKQDELTGRSDVDIRPRYMLWENVPGAFSSNKGEDFRVVLEELAKVKDKDAVIPMPPNGKWTSCGCIMGDGWSIAWRVLDAQFWGVPQRRRRIALVADFGGESAPEILFVRESVSGHSEPGEQKREETASDASRGFGADDNKGTVCYGISPYHSNCMKSDNPHSGIYEAKTARTLDALQCGYPACNQGGIAVVERSGGFLDRNSADARSIGYEEEKVPTIRESVIPSVVAIDRASFNQGQNAQYDPQYYTDGTNPTLVSKGPSGVTYNNGQRYIVRRLTPTECERLQGYPDGWTDIGEYIDTNGKKRQTSDAARYKALGNSIALPPWKWVLKRLCACYERDATMASLFDGIGGFPYLWEQLNGKGTCLWASEIEEFPIAVTKVRIL